MVKSKQDKRRENGLLSVNVDMTKFVRSLGKRELGIVDIMLEWRNIAGEYLAKKLKPVGLSAGKLSLLADSPALSMEIMADKVGLIGKVNSFFGKTLVKDLKISCDHSMKVAPPPVPKEKKHVNVKNIVDKSLYDNIDDEELRQAVFSLAETYYSDNNE